MRTIWPVSYGGSGTNWFAARAEEERRLIDRSWWEPVGCHLPSPVPALCDPTSIPVVLYRDPATAFESQLARGLVSINLRKLGGARPGEPASDAFDRLASGFLHAWTGSRAVFVRYEALINPSVRRDLETALALRRGSLSSWSPSPRRSLAQSLFPESTVAFRAMPDFHDGVFA